MSASLPGEISPQTTHMKDISQQLMFWSILFEAVKSSNIWLHRLVILSGPTGSHVEFFSDYLLVCLVMLSVISAFWHVLCEMWCSWTPAFIVGYGWFCMLVELQWQHLQRGLVGWTETWQVSAKAKSNQFGFYFCSSVKMTYLRYSVCCMIRKK